ncbi:hypothetical protein GQ43DRAFT_141111 [Delitschia confertaspora ATCC 74209]|uniref:Nephrocystin 3-like N-terminal domain-containing protein n=1 Tax=Delitschia confertaspora ATCC 74209 TaxID=1513339 RepID=A0A9P4MYU9_9PLEO|nr:hypothetical protein GQ43DRAFT_141111 [Delitschia confertaspora ATCC 74209]
MYLRHSDSPMGLRLLHPSLGVSHPLSADIFPNLFDSFFETPIFKHWYTGKGTWQLHCIGGPGVGKTTFSALTSSKLKKEARMTGHPVVSIFIQKDVLENESAPHEYFLGRFLLTVINELKRPSCFSNDYPLIGDTEICPPIDTLRETLRRQLSQYHRSFLIVDGVDRCCSALRSQMRQELLAFRSSGLCVMITSRLPVFGIPETADCDIEDCETEDLTLYVECKICQSTLCLPCQEKGEICPNCENNHHLHEPYDRVDFQMTSMIVFDNMEKYIAWDLERQHGDLGLLSSYPRKPPVSNLGMALLEDPTGATPEQLVRNINKRAVYNNVAIAKARLESLDEIHALETLEALEGSRDRLPANIVALFDAEIARIEAQPELQQELGLKAISTVGCHGDSHWGMDGAALEERLKIVVSRPRAAPPASMEDVMEACRGLLLIVPAATEDAQDVPIFHPLLHQYVRDRYNTSLDRAEQDSCRLISLGHDPAVRASLDLDLA